MGPISSMFKRAARASPAQEFSPRNLAGESSDLFTGELGLPFKKISVHSSRVCFDRQATLFLEEPHGNAGEPGRSLDLMSQLAGRLKF